MPLIRETLAAGKNVEFSPRGTSMLPMLRQGMDRVVLSPLPEKLQKYDLPLYQRENGQYVLHRIVGIRPEGYVLCGDNRWRREYGVQDDWILGVLTAVVRDGKEFSVQSRGYRLGVRLWTDLFWARALILRLRDRIRREMRKRGK